MIDLPDVYCIVLDTARRDRFGAYGGDAAVTPVFDEVGVGGEIFTAMLTPGVWTVPNHASLFTGLYPREHGAEWPLPALAGSPATLASNLRAAGYSTAAFAANPILGDLLGGYDLVLPQRHTRVRATSGAGLLRRRIRRLRRSAQSIIGQKPSLAPELLRGLDDWLGRTDGPRHAFLNFMECHWPYVHADRHEKVAIGGTVLGRRLRHFRHAIRSRRAPIYEAVALARAHGTIEDLAAMYTAGVRAADDVLGHTLAVLDRHGRLERAVLIVLSDHGEHLGEDGWASHHCTVRDELARIPFVVRRPDGPRGVVNDHLAQVTDVPGAVLGLLGLPALAGVPPRADGADIFVAAGRTRRHAVTEWIGWAEQHEEGLRRRSPHFPWGRVPPRVTAVSDGRWKLVRVPASADAVYNTSVGEDDEATPPADVLTDLDAALTRWEDGLQVPGGRTLGADETAELERRLGELGYI